MRAILVVSMIAAFAIPPTPVATVRGLRMSISPDLTVDAKSRAKHLVVEFRNVGDIDISFQAGSLVRCNHERGETDMIKLNLVDSTGKAHRHLPFLGDGPPYAGGCGGQITPFNVTLPPRVAIVIPLDLGKYFDWSDSKEYEGSHIPPGKYSLQAELTQIGPIAVSNTLDFNLDHEVGVPLDDYPL